MKNTTITIQVNGKSRTTPARTTIADLLEHLGHNARYLAVEQNRKLVRRTEHAQTILQSGDIVEIVTLVGGG